MMFFSSMLFGVFFKQLHHIPSWRWGSQTNPLQGLVHSGCQFASGQPFSWISAIARQDGIQHGLCRRLVGGHKTVRKRGQNAFELASTHLFPLHFTRRFKMCPRLVFGHYIKEEIAQAVHITQSRIDVGGVANFFGRFPERIVKTDRIPTGLTAVPTH
jgi:hypothetical protein